MQTDELLSHFDKQAAGYDKQWAELAAMRNAKLLLLEGVFAELPADARVLCVGVGTGIEIAHLAKKHPGWSFTAVDPSKGMLDVCRQRAVDDGFADRCEFHEGFLDSHESEHLHDAATCFLVSQFILDKAQRVDFFREIGKRLAPGGLLASSDLSADIHSAEYEVLLRLWMRLMSAGGISEEGIERLRKAYANDVAVLAPDEVASIIEQAGFDRPVEFYRAGLIHAWCSKWPR
ncbi:class I SAM-dependent methyltransferase [Aeoliella sp. SH292]|uniref:class I SAM-dependent methyltransferase n=1 Tax=Aeoliella sp. SH292 TaxID=3454464 RepID=UPI003F9BF0EB